MSGLGKRPLKVLISGDRLLRASSHTRRVNMKYCGLKVLVMVLCCTGCISKYATTGWVSVSPDNEWLIYERDVKLLMACPPEWAVLKESNWVCWAPIEEPNRVKQRRVCKERLQRMYLSVSPGGGSVAVVTPTRFTTIDLSTGETRVFRVNGETLAGFFWLDSSKVVYDTIELADNPPYARTFWKQDVHAPIREREAIHCDTINFRPSLSDLEGGSDQEFGTQDGRYILCRGPGDGRTPHLLNTSTGTMIALEAKGYIEAASWNSTGTRVFFVTSTPLPRQYPGELGAYLFDVARNNLVDLSDKFRKGFRGSLTGVERKWTPDDEFVVGRGLDVGGFLIRPEPWEFREVGKLALAKKPFDSSNAEQFPGSPDFPPSVRRQPAPGMLVASLAPDEVAVDYEGRVVHYLGPSGMSGWIILPDGKRAVTVHADENRIEVKVLE